LQDLFIAELAGRLLIVMPYCYVRTGAWALLARRQKRFVATLPKVSSTDLRSATKVT
jgi:hypothetical protein